MSAKQTKNNKLQSSVAAYLRCGGVVNDQIRKGLLCLWVKFKKFFVNTWQSYKQERDCLMHFFRFLSVLARRAKCMRQPHTDFKSLFTHRLSNKLVLIWLLTTPPHLKYVATCTLPCNLSLMACFADINVSQGSVAIYARCDGIFNIHFTANLLRNLLVIFLKIE